MHPFAYSSSHLDRPSSVWFQTSMDVAVVEAIAVSMCRVKGVSMNPPADLIPDQGIANPGDTNMVPVDP